ncbi:MAG: hypothetical protein A2X12_09415 [Bacteroidetes bacterium GWE2_29_8]|nr:MAG: hypothetical protein A2X12_09415 [Bacteroidetes bacterium GWE2_29_8]OFY17988.1 MAG: hypothetical protein A2X02_04950 [Bacteroidetes bacterium GWF2_29_10]
MKTKYNIEEYFREKTDNLEVSPPENIWNKINNEINKTEVKEKSNLTKSILVKKILMVLIASMTVVGLSGLIYNMSIKEDSTIVNGNRSSLLIKNTQRSYLAKDDISEIKVNASEKTEDVPTKINKKEKQIIADTQQKNDKPIIIANNRLRKSENNDINAGSSTIIVAKENIVQTQINTENTNKKRIYYLNVAGMSNIKKVSIFEENGAFIMELQKISIEKSQVPIDISKLPNGSYTVKITTKGKTYNKRLNISDNQ